VLRCTVPSDTDAATRVTGGQWATVVATRHMRRVYESGDDSGLDLEESETLRIRNHVVGVIVVGASVSGPAGRVAHRVMRPLRRTLTLAVGVGVRSRLYVVEATIVRPGPPQIRSVANAIAGPCNRALPGRSSARRDGCAGRQGRDAAAAQSRNKLSSGCWKIRRCSTSRRTGSDISPRPAEPRSRGAWTDRPARQPLDGSMPGADGAGINVAVVDTGIFGVGP
jgi:hypothetical protein